MAIKQLNSIRIPCKDLKETKEWYKNHLQLEAKGDQGEVTISFAEGADLVFYESKVTQEYPFSPFNINVYEPQHLHRDLFLKGAKLTDIDDFFDMLCYEVTDPNNIQIGIVGWEEDAKAAHPVTKLGGYFLPVRSLEDASLWYKTHLKAEQLYDFSFDTPMYGEMRALTLDHLGITLVEIPSDLHNVIEHPFTLGSTNLEEDLQSLRQSGVEIEEEVPGESFCFKDQEGHKIQVQMIS
ncbi:MULTISPECIES: VOC family protein [Pontibacillus]|uniref:VOC domain-containing protein n=1 Tax=Pontibacillus chungwhensis TaxID=265426 RepID=A0ABY8V1C2_9BACI|nr:MULTISPECIES: hypothetical protein [Pontibacillus]MCD5322449.1 hypothetical protein [Pontibacillus sp. HN14]WIF99735.1 hypothetical protein QNI29_08790 [Pontibacillus chungwhensis]